MGETENDLPVPAGPASQTGGMEKFENNAQEISSYLRPGLVSVSDALVLEVPTWDYRISVDLRKTGNFCTYDRFSADGSRTRTTRVIRRAHTGKPNEGDRDD